MIDPQGAVWDTRKLMPYALVSFMMKLKGPQRTVRSGCNVQPLVLSMDSNVVPSGTVAIMLNASAVPGPAFSGMT